MPTGITRRANPDVLIIGGGIAGLWLLDECRRNGHDALLVESKALGQGQTIASQGILHGGLKYSLAGALGGFVDAIKEMPPLWRTCLEGNGEPNLSRVKMRSQYCCIWQNGSFTSKLGQLGALLGLRTSVSRLVDSERPVALKNCPGDVYRLEEQVLDPRSLLAVLAERNGERIILAQELRLSNGQVVVSSSESGDRLELRPAAMVLSAGEGNAMLRQALHLDPLAMQKRPLPILVVKGNLPDLNGHCISTTKARAIVTTQRLDQRHAVWQIASETAMEMPGIFADNALEELKASLPGFKWPDISFSSYTVNRAEAAVATGERPSDAHVMLSGNVITAWPTKLVLAPRLVQRVMELLPPPSRGQETVRACEGWPRPDVALFPW